MTTHTIPSHTQDPVSRELIDLRVKLECKKAAFQVLRTHTLRKEVKDLEAQYASAKLAFAGTSAKPNGKRRRGVKLSKLHG